MHSATHTGLDVQNCGKMGIFEQFQCGILQEMHPWLCWGIPASPSVRSAQSPGALGSSSHHCWGFKL